ncbi:TRAP transporter large permease [Virgibacillus sp. C22-A2]|uniref:TRAP transporter large permease n=1 Tax=Virgibacillus tibetensis TaxID=3042313 RepID=A0ABU6KDB6_9BACI|nr:TRAP transporter large permease [Virgibacillus sp. C22-A2]
MVTIVLFSSLFLLILLSVPIGIAIGLSTLLTFMIATNLNVSTIAQQVFTSLDSFPLMAIPFFMLAGVLMGKAGVSKRLLYLAETLVGWIVGGLAMVTILGCMFFSAISGSGPATVAAMGSIMIPEMRAKNYGAGFSAAVTASAGAIGIIIPPSIPLVLFGVVGGVSISSLFMAGIIPGVLIGVALMVASYIIIRKKGDVEAPNEKISFKMVIKAVYDAKWAIIAPVIILGGIYGGIFTPTEAGVVTVVYALFVGIFIHKELKWKEIKESFIETINITGITLYMIGLSISFAYLLTIERVPDTIAATIFSITENTFVILIMINIFLIIIGTFVDTIAALVILTPVLLPVAVSIGVDPVHFGIIMIINLAIGFVTPPLGVNLYIASAISKISIEDIVRPMVPLIITLILCLLVISYFPVFSLLLPNLSK